MIVKQIFYTSIYNAKTLLGNVMFFDGQYYAEDYRGEWLGDTDTPEEAENLIREKV